MGTGQSGSQDLVTRRLDVCGVDVFPLHGHTGARGRVCQAPFPGRASTPGDQDARDAVQHKAGPSGKDSERGLLQKAHGFHYAGSLRVVITWYISR